MKIISDNDNKCNILPDCKNEVVFQLTISFLMQSITCQPEALATVLKEPVDDFKYSSSVFLPCLYSRWAVDK